MFGSRVLHGIPPRWLASVRPRIRWRFLLACLAVSLVALVATLVAGALVPGQDGDVSSHANPFTTSTFHYLLVILFLTPFQAAGEEYLFRGYLTQAIGGMFGSAWVAVLLPAFLFGLAHGLGQSPPVFFDRFAFGLVAGVLVVRTGGLEAGIAMHVLNNFLAYGVALAFGDMATTLNPTGSNWWTIPVTLTQSLVYLWLAVPSAAGWGSRRRRVRAFWRPPAAACNLSRRSAPCSSDCSLERLRATKAGQPLGYGVIGSTTGSGPVSLGSSPSTPARIPAPAGILSVWGGSIKSHLACSRARPRCVAA